MIPTSTREDITSRYKTSSTNLETDKPQTRSETALLGMELTFVNSAKMEGTSWMNILYNERAFERFVAGFHPKLADDRPASGINNWQLLESMRSRHLVKMVGLVRVKMLEIMESFWNLDWFSRP